MENGGSDINSDGEPPWMSFPVTVSWPSPQYSPASVPAWSLEFERQKCTSNYRIHVIEMYGSTVGTTTAEDVS
jgi:hypothetical protein